MPRGSPKYQAFFVPDDVDPDEAVTLGLRWLLEQSGEPLILFHRKLMVSNNRLLDGAAKRYRITYEAPGTVRAGAWGGGSILAPWASDEVIRSIDDRLAFKTDAVCIIGWSPGTHDSWIAARGAVDLRSGTPLGKSANEIINDPVVRIALDHAERFVNHNNSLVQAEDKAYLILTLQELVRGGHPFDLEEVAAYAMATGWTGAEVARIREYGRRVLDGRGFRLRAPVGPKRGACKYWEDEAKKEDRSPEQP